MNYKPSRNETLFIKTFLALINFIVASSIRAPVYVSEYNFNDRTK